ncbi:MAG: CBS domain-containing protein [Candidatus Rokubacteria bacterium]|nr:CBS domain-containing protein [Candidatus Rokubacteria bacterium]
MLGEMSIKPVVTIAPDASVQEAARLMRTKKVGALIVTNARKPIGILTDRDITVDVVAAGSDPATTTVSSVMHRRPRVLREDQGLFDAVKAFSGAGVRRLPVVNRAGMVKGIIALDDVLMLLGNEMAHVSTALSRSLGRPAAAA